MKLYYIFPHGRIDIPSRRAMTLDEVLEFIESIELTPSNIELKKFRPDIFDMGKVKNWIETLNTGSLCLWGEERWSVARDKHSENSVLI